MTDDLNSRIALPTAPPTSGSLTHTEDDHDDGQDYKQLPRMYKVRHLPLPPTTRDEPHGSAAPN